MFNMIGLSDREILEKLLDVTMQNHALVCNLSKNTELEKNRQAKLNDCFNHRIGSLEKDVEEIKKKIAI